VAVLLDRMRLNDHQRANVYEDGTAWVIDDETLVEIKLDAAAATQLLSLLQHWHGRVGGIPQHEIDYARRRAASEGKRV
jgi:hypothetical protein